MAMAAADMRRRDVLLSRLKDVWSDLTSEERAAVEVVVNAIILNHSAFAEEAPFQPLSEAELFERIDTALAEADAGAFMDSEAFEAEIAAELGLS